MQQEVEIEEVEGGEGNNNDWSLNSAGQKGRECQFRDLELDEDHMATTNQLIANLGNDMWTV